MAGFYPNFKNTKKNRLTNTLVKRFFVVGVVRFELTASWSRTEKLSIVHMQKNKQMLLLKGIYLC